MKNKHKIKIAIVIIIVIFFTYNNISNIGDKSLPNTDKSINKIYKKTITRDAIVKKIHEKQDLITTEVELNNKIILDDSWGNLDVFKKLISIDFYGTGIYTVDLSKLDKENVLIEPLTTITFKLPKPKVKSITLNEDKTVFKTENGLLRFGDIKLTPAENQLLNKKSKEKMHAQLNQKQLVESSLSSAEKMIKKNIQRILSPYDNYNIIIKFIDK